jgi:hypothetical protein
MKKLKRAEVSGFSQLFVLLGMLLVAISLPVATNLVQQNQENRSSAATACTSYVYSGWGACDGGTKKRTVTGYFPSGCTGTPTINKLLTATCSTTPTTCTYIYGFWSACDGKKQTREVVSKTPSGCTEGTKVLQQSCTINSSPSLVVGSMTCDDENVKKWDGSKWTQVAKCSTKDLCSASGTTGYCKEKYECFGDDSDFYPLTASGTQTKKDIDCAGKGCNQSTGQCETISGTTTAKCGSKNNTSTDHAPGGTEACQNGSISFTDSTAANGTYDWMCKVSTTDYVSCSAATAISTSTTSNSCSVNGGQCVANTDTCVQIGTMMSGTCDNKYVCCKVDSPTALDCSPNGKIRCVGSGQLEECILSKWATATKCTSGVCDSAGTGCGDCSPNGKIRCVGSGQLEECILSKWATATKCTSGKCDSAGTGCGTSGGGNNGGGNDGGDNGGDNPTTCSISVTPKTLSLRVGESGTVVASSNCSNNITWSSSAGIIATITSNGIVTAVAVGTANMTATDSNGKTATVVVTVIASDVGTLSFKIAFAGIKPSYINNEGLSYSCIGSLGDLTTEILNRPTNTYKSFSDVEFAVVGNEVDSKGNQVFQVTNMQVGSEFDSVNAFNNVKVKGPFHLKRRMCLDGQSGKLDETTTCNIDLFRTDGYVYDFSEYTLLAGDVNLDGVINGIDYSLVKNALNANAEPYCGREYDLNMDGVVNALDLNLVKDSLSSIDDE